MSDPLEMVGLGVGGVATGGLLVKLLGWSGSRNIGHLDTTLEKLSSAVADLSRQVQGLREANISLAKDVGQLQAANTHLQQRIDGQGEYWRKKIEELEQRLPRRKPT